jgi:signal transduction histidine kinase
LFTNDRRLDNAAKYTPENGPIRVALRREGRNAALSTADDGIGLTPEALTRIFDVFARVDSSGQRLRRVIRSGDLAPPFPTRKFVITSIEGRA